MRRPVLLALLAILLHPAAARAATVSLTDGTLRVAAAAGEANRIRVDAAGGGPTARVSDWTGTTLTPGSGCVADGGGGVSCALAGLRAVSVAAGDGDDEVAVTAD